jgi:cob(I)alamin adenosyltransferase
MERKGLIHIYCGDGKGKTTAALGLALRAAGSGMKVHIIQLLKGGPTSELGTLALIPNITVNRPEKNYGFTFNMSEDEKRELASCHDALLTQGEKLMNEGSIDMLIIDEFCAAYEYGLLNHEIADRIVLCKPQNIELVLTGRNPHEKIIAAADYVSEIHSLKHPYDKGISARIGIEY